ncbi:hypothetical protein [Pedobacter gandavensis]|uniref:hypothetical protein n=1 Tax=Pedobacter gandavensis TaxID=2679963 RepID=UPI002931B8D7|nr:hypothetical protein [Pedobacter gandavensis]
MNSEQNLYSILSQLILPENKKKQSNDLFDNWVEGIIKKDQYTFNDGIIGLGWLVAFLIEKQQIEGNVDEILEDVDDNLYKFTLKTILDEQTEIDQILVLIEYYHQRLFDIKSKAGFYRRFSYYENMKLLLEKLNTILGEPITDDNLNLKIRVLLKYSHLIQTCIPETLIEVPFYQQIERLINYFQELEPAPASDELTINLLKLSMCAKQYENPYWVEKVNEIYAKLIEPIYQEHQSSVEISIWKKTISSLPEPTLGYYHYHDYWKTEKGKHLLFTLYTNIKSFELSYD